MDTASLVSYFCLSLVTLGKLFTLGELQFPGQVSHIAFECHISFVFFNIEPLPCIFLKFGLLLSLLTSTLLSNSGQLFWRMSHILNLSYYFFMIRFILKGLCICTTSFFYPFAYGHLDCFHMLALWCLNTMEYYSESY